MIGHQITAPFVRALATNASSSGFTAKTAGVTTKPSGNLVYPIADPSYAFRSRVRLMAIGVGSDNDVFALRVWGWSRVGSGNGPAGIIWVPAMLGEITCTLSTFVGVASSPVLNTERFADTMALVATVGEPTVTADVTRTGTTEVYSPANNTPAWVEFRLRGVELLELDFDQTTGTPTMNALLQFLGGSE